MDDGGTIPAVKDGATPVRMAAQCGHVDVVKFLTLEADADPNKADKVCSRA